MAHHEHFGLIPIDIADDPDRPLIDNGNRLHCQRQKMIIRIPTACSPHETWVSTKAPDFFAAVRQQGLR